MGMYDTVRAKCPDCKEWMSEQTKSGPCDLNVYTVGKSMDIVGAFLAEGMRLTCEHCDVSYTVKTNAPKNIQAFLEQENEESDDDFGE